jgi:hypothetical protein
MKLLFSLFLPFTFILTAQAALTWEEIKQDDGITVYSADVPDTPIIAFKGKAVVDASAKKVLWVLADRKHRKDWVNRLNINEELEIISKVERIIYQSFDMPILISNRDMVYRTVLTKDNSTGIYKFSMSSVDHKDAPETIGVRARLINSTYIVKPISDSQTEVTVEILSDPQGLLPTWIVNLVQKSWPLKTLRALRIQVKKDFVQEYDIDLK